MIDFLSISITNGILIFLLITVLVFFCLYLYSDNQKLKEQIEEIRKENKSLLEKKIMNQESVDAISIKNISNEKLNIDYNERLNIKPKECKKVENLNNDIKQINKINHIQEKNISKEEFKYDNFIEENKEEKINNYIYNNPYNTIEHTKNTNFNLNELINKNNYVKINNSESIKEYDYLEELSNRLSEELKPQTIELTEYEKKQEEQAVISYKELLKFKDNSHMANEKQETVNFIEELKNLRNSLK